MTQDTLDRQVIAAFHTQFGEPPAALVRAPGRVNLIGEHTDYNDGFVLPLAIERAVWIALRPRSDRNVKVRSLDYDTLHAFDLDALARPSAADDGWIEYVKGTAHALAAAGYPTAGWEGTMAGDVPIGAGLSSSAALELATARAFQVVAGFAWDAARMALVGQAAENNWVGVNCGIMDQMIAASGVTDHALLIDCRTLATQAVPLPAGTAVVILDTGTRRGLVDSAYNERRAQCEAAAAFFAVPALRDVTPEQLAAAADQLPELTYRRARHVVTENARVLTAVAAMRAGDSATLGQLMDASHSSLRDDFAVSSPALNTMVVIARGQHGCYGARMTGAGFGGCAVALVDAAAVEAFVDAVPTAYRAATDHEPRVYVTRAAAGAAIMPL